MPANRPDWGKQVVVVAVREKRSYQAPSLQPTSSVWQLIAVCLVFWMLAACLQWRAGVFAVELGNHPDEAAHYVTGVMLRDYVAAGHFAHPRAFVEAYYAHYPKIGLLMWPPLFHITEAVWTLVFNESRTSALLLEGLITALLATSIFGVIRRRYSVMLAFAAGALFLMLPLVQFFALQMVMADALVALLMFWAMLCVVRYLERERTRDAVMFGVCAALAFATKPNGVALVLLPILAIVFSGRYYLLKRPGLYYAAGIVLFFGVPWQVISYKLIAPTMGPQPHLTLLQRLQPALFYARVLPPAFGWVLMPFFVLGLGVFVVRLSRGDRSDMMSIGALALLLSVLIFHSALTLRETRYMLSAVPAMMLFTASGFDWLVRRIPVASVPVRSAALGAVVVVLVVAQAFTLPRMPHWGLDDAAQYLLAHKDYQGAGFLIVANADGEGAFVSEVVMHDSRPDHVVLRSSKVLASANWFGGNYELQYPTTEALRNFLNQAPISAVVLDTWPPDSAADDVQVADYKLEQSVAQALSSNPDWQAGDSFPHDGNEAGRIKVYTRVGPQPVGDVQLHMQYTLGSNLVVHNGADAAKISSGRSEFVVLAVRIIAAMLALSALGLLVVRSKRRAIDA